MNKKLYITAFLALFSLDSAFACKCKEIKSLQESREKSFEYSEIVFLGQLIEFDRENGTYKFEIIELYKGKAKSDTISGKVFSSCSMLPMDLSKWIVYANYEEGLTIDISTCLATRSETNPICLGCYEFPPPPKPNQKTDKIEIKLFNRKLIEKAKKDWIAEIEILRNK